jgi:hypothetical protein
MRRASADRRSDETGLTAAVRHRLEREYGSVFLPHGLIPVLVPLGHEVGDVVAAHGRGFVSRRGDCFSNLVPSEAVSNLVAVELTWSAAAHIALGAEGVGDAEARGNADDLVQVRFEAVQAVTASRYQLRGALRSDACPEVKALLEGSISDVAAPDWLLIGQVITARAVVRIRRRREGQAKLSFLQGLAERFGLRAHAEGGGDLSRAETAEVSTAEPLPVAFRPAVVRISPEIVKRFRGPAAPVPIIEQFNANDEAHRNALELWFDYSVKVRESARQN